MNTISLSARECVDICLRAVDHWIGKGLCYLCAIKVVANLKEIDPDKLEALWLDSQVTKLP